MRQTNLVWMYILKNVVYNHFFNWCWYISSVVFVFKLYVQSLFLSSHTHANLTDCWKSYVNDKYKYELNSHWYIVVVFINSCRPCRRCCCRFHFISTRQQNKVMLLLHFRLFVCAWWLYVCWLPGLLFLYTEYRVFVLALLLSLIIKMRTLNPHTIVYLFEFINVWAVYVRTVCGCVPAYISVEQHDWKFGLCLFASVRWFLFGDHCLYLHLYIIWKSWTNLSIFWLYQIW